MKILMVNKFLHANGGSETYTFQLGGYLNEHGHEVQYFGMDHPHRVVGNEWDIYTNNMDFHTSKFQKLFYPFKILYSLEAKKKIRTILAEFHPDVVHVNNFNFQLTPSILYAVRAYDKKHRKKTRIVFTAHDSQLVCPNHLMYNQQLQSVCVKCMEHTVGACSKYKCIHGSRLKSILGTLEARLYGRLHTYRMIDAIISPSQFLANRLATHPDLAGRIYTMTNFLNQEELIPPSKGVKSESPYALYFGRYSSEKGIDFLTNICQELPHVSFRFAGSGPLEDRVEKVANITNVGFQQGEDLHQLIANAQFSLCTSSCYENCPYSVLESQYLGTPVIGVNQGGVSELIQEGKTGLLYEPQNGQELKDKINELWYNSEKCKDMQQACTEKSYVSLETYVRKLLQKYESECIDG
ncbi:MAG: glycosyltransferase family 4 protein [Eubacteriales bacterium]